MKVSAPSTDILSHPRLKSRRPSSERLSTANPFRALDRTAYADCRQELVTAISSIIAGVRRIYPTPESLAACDDVELVLCGLVPAHNQDELQLTFGGMAA